MAEDKEQQTEDPSGKRLSDARESGQVAISKEISTFVLLASATASLLIILPWSLKPLFQLLRTLVERPDQISFDQGAALQSLMLQVAKAMTITLAPVFALMLVAAVGSTIGQTGFLWSTSKIKPNFGALNPMTGFGRVLSIRSIIEFGKGLLKVAVVGGVGLSVLMPIIYRLELLVGMPALSAITLIGSTFKHLMTAILSVIGMIAAGDYFYQRWSTTRSLRMTKQEVKEEHKQQEGDPHIKGHFRKIRMTRARRRMMAAVPEASVIVTNPTHFAVALRYDGTSMGAPKVVAKGADFVAKRIREIAQEHDVPIVENPPLARTLYAQVEVDDEIPPEQYKAVAEIIGFVMRLKKPGSAARR